MPANGLFKKRGSGERDRGSADARTRSLLIAAVAVVVAFVLIFLYVRHETKSKTATVTTPANATVLVAATNIPAGTSGVTMVQQNMVHAEVVPASQKLADAVVSTADLEARSAATPIVKGQQITLAELQAVALSTYSGQLTGDERALAISLDAEHGQTATLNAGDRVDIIDYAGTAATLLATNILVLSNKGGIVMLELTDKQTLLMIAAQGGGGALWLTLRPSAGRVTESVHIGEFIKAP